MEPAVALREAAAVLPASGKSAGSSVISMVWREGLRRAIHVLLQVATRFRRLLGVLARQPGLVLGAIFRAPGSLAKLVRSLLLSKPARILVAAAASIICITLHYHRPTVADIQLSSSISLLFGIIKLQGSLAFQLGPPESRNSLKFPERQAEELRINCSKDLKESIVRFLESQAAANCAMQTQAASGQQLSPRPEELMQLQDPRQQREPEEVRQLLLAVHKEQEGEAPRPTTDAYHAFTFMLNPLAAATGGDGGNGDSISGDGDARGGASPGEYMSYGSVGSAVCGFESCCSDAFQEAAPVVAGTTSGDVTSTAVVAKTAAATAVATAKTVALLPAAESLLPSTSPPLRCSPPAKPAEPTSVDRSGYLSLLSYAATYKPSVAALESPRTQSAAQGSYAGLHGIPSQGLKAAETSTEEARGGAAMLAADAVVAAAGRRHHYQQQQQQQRGGGSLQKSPDSILGLRNLGLEGWAESSRRWENRYLELEN